MICPYEQDTQCHLQYHIHTDCSSTNFQQNKYLWTQATNTTSRNQYQKKHSPTHLSWVQVQYVRKILSLSRNSTELALTSITIKAEEKQNLLTWTARIHCCYWYWFGNDTLSILRRYVETLWTVPLTFLLKKEQKCNISKQVVKVIWQKGRIAAAHGRFNHISQVAPMSTQSNTCFLDPPKSTSQMSSWSVQLFCTAHGSMSLYFTMDRLLSPQNCLFPWGTWTPSNLLWLLGPTTVHNPNGISIGSVVFAGLMIVTDRLTDHTTPSVITGRIYVHTPWVKKGCHPNHGYNYVNSWSICKILSLLQRAVNFQQNQY